jgi:hypothetical protein
MKGMICQSSLRSNFFVADASKPCVSISPGRTSTAVSAGTFFSSIILLEGVDLNLTLDLDLGLTRGHDPQIKLCSHASADAQLQTLYWVAHVSVVQHTRPRPSTMLGCLYEIPSMWYKSYALSLLCCDPPRSIILCNHVLVLCGR